MKGCIYKITSPTGRSYIGQTINLPQRKSDYKALNCKKQQKIYHSILKYGWQNHTFDILEEIEHEIFYYEIANACEIYWIKFYDSVKNGLNIQEGGKNCSLSQETRDKISAKHKGKKHSEEHNEKVRLAAIGRKASDETKQKLSKAKIGKPGNRKGIRASYETKQKLSKAHIGKNTGSRNQEWKDNMNKANERRYKKIKCLTNNKIYDSISQAAHELDLETSKISAVCKQKRNHTKNYKFQYC